MPRRSPVVFAACSIPLLLFGCAQGDSTAPDTPPAGTPASSPAETTEAATEAKTGTAAKSRTDEPETPPQSSVTHTADDGFHLVASGPSVLDPDAEYAYMWGEQGQMCTPCFDGDDPPPEISASSALKGYPAANVMDDAWLEDIHKARGALDRAWCEGKPDAGVGEWIEFKYSEEMLWGFLEITPAYAKSKDTLTRNNQVKKLSVWMDAKKMVTVEFAPMKAPHSYHRMLGGFGGHEHTAAETALHEQLDGTKFRSLKFVIEEVYPSAKDNDTCISAIVPWVWRQR